MMPRASAHVRGGLLLAAKSGPGGPLFTPDQIFRYRTRTPVGVHQSESCFLQQYSINIAEEYDTLTFFLTTPTIFNRTNFSLVTTES